MKLSDLGAAIKGLSVNPGGDTGFGSGLPWYGLNRGASLIMPSTRIDYRQEAGDLSQNAIVMGAIWFICRNFGDATPRVIKRADSTDPEVAEAETPEKWVPVQPHPLTELLDNPNPYYSGQLLIWPTLLSWTIDGNAYWLVERDPKTDVPTALWYEPHFTCRPVWDRPTTPNTPTPFIKGYQVLRNSEWKDVASENVVHFRHGLDPANPRVGLSPLKSALREIFTDNEASAYSAQLLKNLAIPSLFVSPAPGANTAIIKNPRALKDEIMAKYTGDRRGEPLVTSAPTRVEMMSFSPQQLDLSAMRQVPEERLTHLLGLNAVVLGLGAGKETMSFHNYREALQAAWRNNLIVTQKVWAAEIDRALLPEWETDRGGIKFEYDVSHVWALSDDVDAIYDRTVKAWVGGILKRKEARAALPEHFDGDEKDDLYFTDIPRLAARITTTAPAGSVLEGEQAAGDIGQQSVATPALAATRVPRLSIVPPSGGPTPPNNQIAQVGAGEGKSLPPDGGGIGTGSPRRAPLQPLNPTEARRQAEAQLDTVFAGLMNDLFEGNPPPDVRPVVPDGNGNGAKAIGYLAPELKYSPDQPRDEHGRWSDGGGSGGTGSGPPAASTLSPPPVAARAFAQAYRDVQAPDGGWSINVETGKGPGEHGFMVSEHGSEVSAPITKLTPDIMTGYAKEHMVSLQRPGSYFGGWHDGETHDVAMDVSHHFWTREDANAYGVSNQQKALFNLETGQSEPITYPENASAGSYHPIAAGGAAKSSPFVPERKWDSSNWNEDDWVRESGKFSAYVGPGGDSFSSASALAEGAAGPGSTSSTGTGSGGEIRPLSLEGMRAAEQATVTRDILAGSTIAGRDLTHEDIASRLAQGDSLGVVQLTTMAKMATDIHGLNDRKIGRLMEPVTDLQKERVDALAKSEAEYYAKGHEDETVLYAKELILGGEADIMGSHWNETTTSTDALAMQVAASEKFNIPLDQFTGDQWDRIAPADAQGNYYDRSKADALATARSYLDAQYAYTQKYFADQGITEVPLARGVYFAAASSRSPTPPAVAALGENESKAFNLSGSPLTSWTNSSEVAQRFAGSGNGPGFNALSTATIPVKYILSTGLTGAGAASEGEYIVAAQNIPATVTRLDSPEDK